MPYLEKRKGGHVVRWREGGRDTKLQCSPIYRRKDEALAKARELGVQVIARRPMQQGADLTMCELLTRYRVRRLGEGARDSHVDRAIARVASLCDSHGWRRPRDVTPSAVQEWRQTGGSPRAGAMLRAVLRWGMEMLDQAVDPRALVALRPRAVRRRPKDQLPTAAQVAAWQAKADGYSASVGALIHCLSTYGWRPITAADLTVGDVDLDDSSIVTSVKGGDVVRHPLLPETVKRLRPLVAGRKGSAPLFIRPTVDAGWVAQSSLGGSIPRWCADALGMKSYDLKRWAISRMLDRGLPPQTVALFTGHRTIGQVLRYARTNDEQARAALSVMGSGEHQ
jgi:hypothetical protein